MCLLGCINWISGLIGCVGGPFGHKSRRAAALIHSFIVLFDSAPDVSPCRRGNHQRREMAHWQPGPPMLAMALSVRNAPARTLVDEYPREPLAIKMAHTEIALLVRRPATMVARQPQRHLASKSGSMIAQTMTPVVAIDDH